jgi:hypothetical protein
MSAEKLGMGRTDGGVSVYSRKVPPQSSTCDSSQKLACCASPLDRDALHVVGRSLGDD